MRLSEFENENRRSLVVDGDHFERFPSFLSRFFFLLLCFLPWSFIRRCPIVREGSQRVVVGCVWPTFSARFRLVFRCDDVERYEIAFNDLNVRVMVVRGSGEMFHVENLSG